jgi:hypothetical protein
MAAIASDFTVFAPPSGAPLEIEPAPRLDSWMRRDHPDQVRLRDYLDWLTLRVAVGVASENNTLGLRVAMPSSLDSGGSDLDNFLYPVIRALGAARFVSVWGWKQRGGSSTIVTAQAEPSQLPDPSWAFASAETSQPKDSREWKVDIDDQIRGQVSRPVDALLEVQIAYVVEPSWNWAALWKPTIDALGAIVGEASRPFNARDDRIIALGLHRVARVRSPRRTSVGVWWRALDQSDISESDRSA